MKNSVIYYSIGALLYSPANNEGIVNSITSEKFGNKYSLALTAGKDIISSATFSASAWSDNNNLSGETE